MDIHERLKYLRAQLHLTTRAFGASINMSGGAITNMGHEISLSAPSVMCVVNTM